MSRTRWLTSALIVFHLTALTVDAIPEPALLDSVTEVRHPQDAVAASVTPSLDRAARLLGRIEPALYALLSPLRALTQPYIAAGLGRQRWNMFSNPFTRDQYVRIDAWVETAGSTQLRLFREVVLPQDDEKHVRLVHRYRDKAMLNALENVTAGLAQRRRASPRPIALADLEDDDPLLRNLDPILRWGRHRVERQLGSGMRVRRTELWLGEAPNPARGGIVDEAAERARLDVIEPYHHGPVEVRVSDPIQYPRGVGQREVDMNWTLLHIQR